MHAIVSHWDKGRDGLCPDCGKQETDSHLNLCSDPDRRRLLHDMMNNLHDNNFTHQELAYPQQQNCVDIVVEMVIFPAISTEWYS